MIFQVPSFDGVLTNGLHIDGNFVEVDISLSFQEIAALDKLKVSKEGF